MKKNVVIELNRKVSQELLNEKEKFASEIFKMEKVQTNNLTKDVVRRFKSSQEIFTDATDEAEADYLSRFAYICMLSFDVYLKKQIIERIIDETLDNEPKKK